MGRTVPQMRTWTDERDGERWLILCRLAENATTARLSFRSQSELRDVRVPSNILLDALTDREIRDLLDRVWTAYRIAG